MKCPKCGRKFDRANCYGNHKKSCHKTIEQIATEFWLRVDNSTRGCWEWKGTLAGAGYVKGVGFSDGEGYGKVQFRGKKVAAHRLAWELTNGTIPKGRWVLHRCDNPRCCRPSHLFLGDCASNHADMAKKGRSAATISQKTVLRIASLLRKGLSYGKTAEAVRVSKGAIAHIAKGRSRVSITGGPIRS